MLIWQKYLKVLGQVSSTLPSNTSTKYFWISKCQVQVSTKYSIFCIKYQVQVLYLTPTLVMNHPQWLQWVIPSWSFFREPNDGVAEKCWGRGTSSSSIHAGVDATRSCNEFPVPSGCLRHGWHQGWPPPYHYLARRKGCGAQRGTEGALCDMWRCVTKPGFLQPTWQWEDLLHTEPIWPHTPDLLHFRCASLAEDDKELHGEFWFPPSDTAALERWSLHLLDAYLASLSGACWESAVHTMPQVEEGSCWSHFLQSNEG